MLSLMAIHCSMRCKCRGSLYSKLTKSLIENFTLAKDSAIADKFEMQSDAILSPQALYSTLQTASIV